MATERHKTDRLRRIRALHRDIGFFVVGLTVVYALSGLVLTYRDTGLLKREQQVEKTLARGLGSCELARALHLRDLEVIDEDAGMIRFRKGTYNRENGQLRYRAMELPGALKAMVSLHKTPSRSGKHYFALLYSACLLFLALSSFWMFPRASGKRRRGFKMAGAGLVLALLLLIF